MLWASATLLTCLVGFLAPAADAGAKSKIPPPSSDAFSDISCTSSSWCVAVGTASYQTSGNETLAETFDGTTWNLTPSPNGTESNNYLSSVSCLSADDCMAVGYTCNGPLCFDPSATIGTTSSIAETWNGSSWSMVPTPALDLSYLQGVSCTTPTFCIATGGYYGQYNNHSYGVIEEWNGTAWSISDQIANTGGLLWSVSCVGTDFCMAIGAGSPMVLNGTEWSNIPESPKSDAVSCTSDTSCVVVGGDDQAASWDNVTYSWTTQTALVRATARDPHRNLLLGLDRLHCGWHRLPDGVNGGTAPLVESLTGSTWSVLASPATGVHDGIPAITCENSTSCVAVGDQNATIDQPSSTLATQWDGTQWSAFSTANDGVFITPATGPPRTSITAGGGGFTPGEQVSVTFEKSKTAKVKPICAALATSDGLFTCSGNIPKNTGSQSSNLVFAQGGTSGIVAETNFYRPHKRAAA